MAWISELEESKEEGREEGELLRLIKMVYKKMLKGKTNEEIADEAEEDMVLIEKVKKAIIEYRRECGNEEFKADEVIKYYKEVIR